MSLEVRSFAQLGALILALGIATPASAQWKVGQEREVDEGYYMTLADSFSGWRLWRTETREGISCQVVKSAVGKPHPVPLGSQNMLYRGTPYLRISSGYQTPFSYDLRGRYGYGRTWRIVGERFWNKELKWDDLEDATQIEVNLETWEYPAVKVGLVRERGIINLAGLNEAISKLAECDDDVFLPGQAEVKGPVPVDGPPKPRSNPYPLSQPSESGVVGYRLEINVFGSVTNCEITQSSGSANLDRRACRDIGRFRKFEPAKNENGASVIGYYEGTMEYALND